MSFKPSIEQEFEINLAIEAYCKKFFPGNLTQLDTDFLVALRQFYTMMKVSVFSHRYDKNSASQKLREDIGNAAIKICNEIINKEPNYHHAYRIRSKVNFNLNNYETALDDITTAFDIAPDRDALSQICKLLPWVGRNEEIIKKAQGLHHTYPRHYNIGNDPSLEMVKQLYEKQQIVAKEQLRTAVILSIIGILIPVISHLVIWLVFFLLRANDIVANTNQETYDATYRSWGRYIEKDMENNSYNLYFISNRAREKLQASDAQETPRATISAG